MATRRRDLIVISGAAVVAIAIPPILRHRGQTFEFQRIPGLRGFRRLPAAVSSGADLVLTGLEAPTALQQRLRKQVTEQPCQAVFETVEWPEDRVPVAVFTDYNCPYCPVLSEHVIKLTRENAPIDVVWHDLPVLGPRSEAAAKAALAAAAQGKYLPVHQHLMQSVLRPGSEQLVKLARAFDMDENKFLRDIDGPAVAQKIEHTRAIAAVFGIVGTPATLVGRTLVIGKINKRNLKQLISIERETPFTECTS